MTDKNSASYLLDLDEDKNRKTLREGLKRHLAQMRYLNALLLALVVVLLTFHPWLMDFIAKASSVIPLLLLVLMFVYVINPLTEFILNQIRRLPGRHWVSYKHSLIITYILLLIVFAAVLCFFIPKLVVELRELAVNIPDAAVKLKRLFLEYRHSYFDTLPVPVRDKVTEAVGAVGSMIGQMIEGGIAYAGAFSSAVVWVLGAMIMVPLFSYYVLCDGRQMYDNFLRLLPAKKRNSANLLLLKLHEVMKSFVKGQSFLCMVIGTVITICMAFVLPEYCIGLGIIAGITEAIPIVGPILGAVPAVMIAFGVPGKGGLGLAVLVAVIYTIVQQLEGNFLVPKIMGKSLGLHPFSLLLGMLAFGNIFGFWGVVLAAPLVGFVKVILMHISGQDTEGEQETSPDPPDSAGSSENIAGEAMDLAENSDVAADNAGSLGIEENQAADAESTAP
ncbi:MAG: AI-2E family transporter [bacterium]|nr:AI-2E family transporter [bacterium]